MPKMEYTFEVEVRIHARDKATDEAQEVNRGTYVTFEFDSREVAEHFAGSLDTIGEVMDRTPEETTISDLVRSHRSMRRRS